MNKTYQFEDAHQDGEQNNIVKLGWQPQRKHKTLWKTLILIEGEEKTIEMDDFGQPGNTPLLEGWTMKEKEDVGGGHTTCLFYIFLVDR